MKNLIVLAFCVLNCYVVLAQQNKCNSNNSSTHYSEKHSEVIKKDLKFKSSGNDNIFMIDNVAGNIEIEGYGGNSIQIEIEKVIKAGNKSDLQDGMEAIQVGTFQNDSGIFMYVDAPFVNFDQDNMKFDYSKNSKNSCNNNNNGNSGNYQNGDHYQFELNYKVKLPKNVNIKIDNLSGVKVDVRNINGEMMQLKNGSGHIAISDLKVEEISVRTMSGHITGENIEAETINANTISGHVKLYDVNGAAMNANTNSGHVYVTYTNNPSSESSYTTMNGHVDVAFQPGLNAEVSQKVNGNGKLFSDFVELSNNKNTNTKPKKGKSCSSTCSANKMAQYTVGKGGEQLSFTTGNGHVKVRKI